MRPFCPDGYVLAREAIARAALFWFPQQMATLETLLSGELASNKANDEASAVTPVKKLAHALGGQRPISEGLQQQAADLLIQAEHRLRNCLHQGVLAAFYFGGLFHQGRQSVACEFWATAEADGVLMSGSFWPFGQPRAWHEQRPSHPLYFLESELAALLRGDPKSSPHFRAAGNRRGSKPKKLERVKEAMRRDFSQASELQNMLEKDLAAKYGVSRDTARKARAVVVLEMVDNSILDK